MKTVIISSLACAAIAAVTSCSKAPEPHSGHDHGAAPAAPTLPTGKTTRPAEAKLYIVSPADGAEVSSPVVVNFGLKGMGVAPAGIYLEASPSGHHHLMVDVEELPDLNLPLPKDETHIHFGGGQTETTLKLEPGTHTLQLVLGDHGHVPHDPPMKSEKITITVK